MTEGRVRVGVQVLVRTVHQTKQRSKSVDFGWVHFQASVIPRSVIYNSHFGRHKGNVLVKKSDF